MNAAEAQTAAQTMTLGEYRKLSWTDRWDVALYLVLTQDERDAIEAKVRKDASSADEDWKTDAAVGREQRSIADKVAGWMSNGDDTRWLAAGLSVLSGQMYDDIEKYGALSVSSPKIDRAEYVAAIGLRVQERRDDLAWRRSEVEAGRGDKWESLESLDAEAATNEEELVLVRQWLLVSPYRLWTIQQEVESWAQDYLRDALLGMALGEGTKTDECRDMAVHTERHFRKLIEAWQKEVTE